jgi:hypothetical protein
LQALLNTMVYVPVPEEKAQKIQRKRRATGVDIVEQENFEHITETPRTQKKRRTTQNRQSLLDLSDPVDE